MRGSDRGEEMPGAMPGASGHVDRADGQAGRDE